MEVLYMSTVCRLCGEENENGSSVYSTDENGQCLSQLINTYLPLKVSDDGKMPCTVCPGCTIQIEATVDFINLIIKGQKIVRERYAKEKEYKKSLQAGKSTAVAETRTENIVYEINTKDGVYSVEHPISLQVAGLERPKRKRGRPPKKPKTEEEIQQEAAEQEKEAAKAAAAQVEESDPSGKRRRKAPTRFQEVVQGKELDRIFLESGVSDEESDRAVQPPVEETEEVIGRVRATGEEVRRGRGRGRGRPRGRMPVCHVRCAICGVEFSCKGRYMAHVAQHGPVSFRCDCGALFHTRLLLNNHQEDEGHQGYKIQKPTDSPKPPTEVPVPLDLPKKDPETPKGPSSVITVDSKTQQVQISIQNTDDIVNIDTTTDFLKEMGVKEEDMKRESVEDSREDEDASATELEPEQTEKVSTKSGVKQKYKCTMCDKMFSSRQSKSMHIKAVHLSRRSYRCNECGASFPYPRSLALHAVSHRRHGVHGYGCDLCGKILNHPSSVMYHKEAEHAGHQYVCIKCGKQFKHKQLLQRHQLVHTQNRPYSCKICSASFKTRANLCNHQILHTGIKKYSCDICKQKFAHKTSLTLHQRLHLGLKPYSCSVCSKTFSQKGNLSEHVRIHTGEKPFSCGLCPRRFTTSSQHRLHEKRHANKHTDMYCAACDFSCTNPARWRLHLAKCKKNTVPTTTVAPIIHTANQNNIIKVSSKQTSLLVSNNMTTPRVVQIPTTPKVVHLPAPSEKQQLIYVTYDVDSGEEYHMLNEQCVTSVDGSVLSEIESSRDEMEIPYEIQEENNDIVTITQVTDEDGNPLHLTMQDGTRLAITSADGNSLQVITQDGQSIPVEINEYSEGNDMESSEETEDAIIQQLSLQKVDQEEDAPVAHYFTIV